MGEESMKRGLRSVLERRLLGRSRGAWGRVCRGLIAAALASALTVLATACGSSDLLDLAFDPPEPKPLDISKVALNSFFANREFGTIGEQYNDITNTLGIRKLRILLPWTDGVQPTPDSALNYSFYDSILSQVPAGVEVVIVLAHTPSWMSDSSNWGFGGNPRTTFVERWVRPTIQRYAGSRGINAWEIWNEPDLTVISSDAGLELTNPDKYAEMLAYASNVVHDENPGALVVMAATQSIQQNFPTNLQYNKRLKELGVENFIDVWNVHYYGTRFESVVTESGVADFLNGVSRAIWVTESGAQGPNNQLNYTETAWPFLSEKIPGIQRFYYYQYASTEPAAQNYGLRTTDANFPVSDLYVYLRDNH